MMFSREMLLPDTTLYKMAALVSATSSMLYESDTAPEGGIIRNISKIKFFLGS
jgi:hypothetical protein